IDIRLPRLIQPDESMNHSNILCDEMDSLYGWSACTTGISGWVRCIPYISKPQLIRDKGGMLRHAPALPHATIRDCHGLLYPAGYSRRVQPPGTAGYGYGLGFSNPGHTRTPSRGLAGRPTHSNSARNRPKRRQTHRLGLM